MTAQHTPGPWVWDDNEGYGSTGVWAGMSPTGSGPAGKLIARIIGDEAVVEANARLIAAAPDLLDALVELAEMHCGEQPASSGHSEDVWKLLHIGKMRAIARAAIAKATGA